MAAACVAFGGTWSRCSCNDAEDARERGTSGRGAGAECGWVEDGDGGGGHESKEESLENEHGEDQLQKYKYEQSTLR